MMRRYLVVADETVGGKPLLDEIDARRKKGESRFVVLVPASVPREGLTWTEAEARGLAEDRLGRVLNHLRERGVEGEGHVADADPFQAIQDTLRKEKFDEVVLSAPSKRSGWLKPNLPGKIQAAFGLRVSYVPGEREGAVRETALMRTPLLAGLPNRQLRSLAKRTMVEGFRPGTTIVEEGSDESDLYVILDGRVRVTVAGRTVEYLSVGELFGEISLLAPGPRMAAVIAESPARCLILSGRDLRAAMASDARLAAKMLEAAGGRLRDISRNFRDAMLSLVLEGDLLEQLSEAAHETYRADELAKGKSGSNLVPYEDLPEEIKEQNRDLVREIPKKLAVAGYVLRTLAAGESPVDLSTEEVELLAEREHDRWVRLKLAQGWSFASSRDDDARRHPSLVPWRELTQEERQRRYGMEGESRVGPGALSEEEKDKDRVLMRRIGSLLAGIGYSAAKVGRPVE
jgi:CRP-like cAMP-binding protein